MISCIVLTHTSKVCIAGTSKIFHSTRSQGSVSYIYIITSTIIQHPKYIPPVMPSAVELCPVPTLLLPKHVYVPASLCWTLLMVSDGVLIVPPLYLLVFVLVVVILVVEPPIFLCQYTLVIGRLEVTVHTKVTVFPVFTE